jgi:hypothetical protein
MAYNDVIDRTGAQALMPEDVASEIIKNISEGSSVTRLARRLPNMNRAQRRLPILSVLPNVYFVGEAGRTGQTFNEIKQTTEARWANKYINAEELAVIVVIPESTLEDSSYDIWGEIKPEIVAAIGAKIDYSILFGVQGVDVPSSWPNGIVTQMPAHHKIPDNFGNDIYDAIFAEGGTIAQVEEDGFFVNGHIARLRMRSKLRGLRAKVYNGSGVVAAGEPLFNQDMHSAVPYTLDGQRIEFPTNGSFEQLHSWMVSGDWNQLVWAMRKDITYKVLTEGVITDNSTPRSILHNLAQDDMIGLRVTFRMGWELPNPINRVQQDDTKRFPFSSLIPS